MTASTEVKIQAPVKGMVFLHASRKNGDGAPWECTVTSISSDTVFWTTRLYQDRRFKTPRVIWEKKCAAVVSVPSASASKPTEPKLTDARYVALMARAHEAGMAAGEGARPVPMVVGSPTEPLGSDIDATKPVYFVGDGVCGFAYIIVRPGNGPFARYLRKRGIGYTSHFGGRAFGVQAFGQSLERKTAYARAYTEVLREAGITAYYESRID